MELKMVGDFVEFSVKFFESSLDYVKISNMVKAMKKLKILAPESGHLQECRLGSLIKSGHPRDL